MAKLNPSDNTILIRPSERTNHRVSYILDIADHHYEVYFEAKRVALDGGPESAVAMAAMGAMKLGLDINVELPGSATFIANQHRLMDIYTDWFPAYSKVQITAAPEVEVVNTPTGRVGSFFTGGVDSFYTFFKHQSEITDLIYVHGYDIKLNDRDRRQAVTEMGQAIERETGVRFIEIETNSIRVFRDFGRWGLHGHGYGLGAAARQLSNYLDKLYIPSSFLYEESRPWGSTPETDPLFSDEQLTIIHDGCEAERIDKVRAIANDSLALGHLRVCWENVEGRYNCSTCEKCLRTMTTLHALGVLQHSKTFSREIDPALIRRLIIYNAPLYDFAQGNIRILTRNGLGDSDICRAWQHISARPKYQNMAIQHYRRLRKKIRRIRKKFAK